MVAGLQQGDVVDERFVIERRAGSGGMGVVYRALDRKIDRKSDAAVALKVLANEDEATRFEREARVLASIRHPGIVRYIAHGQTGAGAFYLAMEWLEGEDLASRLCRGPLDLEETLLLGRRLADTLGAAHALGVIHRDVKPSNIFLTAGDVSSARLLDFGLARAVQPSQNLTATGVGLGTPGYMAPEQVTNASRVDSRADVFSLDSFASVNRVHYAVCRALLFEEQRAPDEALAALESVLSSATGGPSDAIALSAYLMKMRVHLQRGDARSAEETLATIADIPAPAVERQAILTLTAALRLQTGRAEEALALTRETFALVEATGVHHELTSALLPLVYIDALDATGDAEGARVELATAQRRLLARADQILDPELRRSFLENVGHHARLLTMASERGIVAAHT
jgi:serine/threonine protein kinase